MIAITGPEMLAQARAWYRKFTSDENNFILGMSNEYQRGYVSRWMQDACSYHAWDSWLEAYIECESATNECNFLFRRALTRSIACAFEYMMIRQQFSMKSWNGLYIGN